MSQAHEYASDVTRNKLGSVKEHSFMHLQGINPPNNWIQNEDLLQLFRFNFNQIEKFQTESWQYA